MILQKKKSSILKDIKAAKTTKIHPHSWRRAETTIKTITQTHRRHNLRIQIIQKKKAKKNYIQKYYGASILKSQDLKIYSVYVAHPLRTLLHKSVTDSLGKWEFITVFFNNFLDVIE